MKYIYFLFTFLFFLGCDHDFLDTENLNQPDLENVLGNPNDWEDVIRSQFRVVWETTQDASSSSIPAGMADVLTSSWGFMQFESSEPRVQLQNDRGYWIIERPYFQSFEVIGSVNDILRLLNERSNLEIKDDQGEDIKDKLTSTAYLLRGMAYGAIALKYDKSQYIKAEIPSIDAPRQPFENYAQILEKVLQDLETAISIAESAPYFEVNYFNGMNMTKEAYIQFVRTLQAKYSLHISRDSAENEANDWNRILTYAQKGMNFDLIVVANNDWFDNYKWNISWAPFPAARVDYRVIAAMAKNTPSRFPEMDSLPLLEPEAIDQRLLTDMTFEPRINFPPERGRYYFSHYLFSRYGYYQNSVGDLPWILKAENDLMIAEALIRTGGSKAEAANLINLTRVERGGLAPLTGVESDQEMYDAIMHERFIELLGTNGGQPFFDRRRLPDDDGSLKPYTGLQPCTARQLPVPIQELDLLGMGNYTFGGC